MPKVYVSQKPQDRGADTIDISTAAEYGELHYMFPPTTNMRVVSMPLVQAARRQLKDYCDDDSILAIGNPVFMAVACAIAADMNRGRFAVLVWDRLQRTYIRYRLNTRGLAND